jgi:hypothetical protein
MDLTSSSGVMPGFKINELHIPLLLSDSKASFEIEGERAPKK